MLTATALLAALAPAVGVWSLVEVGRARRRAMVRRPRRRSTWGAPLRRALRRAAPPSVPAGLAARLEVAGVDGWLGARELMAVKVLLAAVAVLAGAAPGGRLGVLGLLLAPTFAFLLPDLLLAQRARRRAAHLRAEVPQVIDRVRLAVGAGLAPGRALEHAARHGDGPLAQELRRAVTAVEVGASQADALRRVARRCPVPEVEGLAAVLLRTWRSGTPCEPALAALALQVRAERARRIRDRAQRAAPKIQLVVALLLVSAALLLIAAGVLAELR